MVLKINQSKAISAQISDLRSNEYQLVRPLPVTISEEDNLPVVTSYDLNLFGYGETEDEAIQDLEPRRDRLNILQPFILGPSRLFCI